MKYLHVFTEEPSIKNVFEVLIPRFDPNIQFRVHPHQGKEDLKRALTKVVPSLSRIPDTSILITMDQDNNDCMNLKSELNAIIEGKCHCDMKIRIVCKELEAWFLGDMDAIELAYPRFKASSHKDKATFKNVDKITRPSKTLLRVIPDFNKKTVLPKLAVSMAIASHMEIAANKSKSFINTFQAIKSLIT